MNKYQKIKFKWSVARRVFSDSHFPDVATQSALELRKKPIRHEIINYLIGSLKKAEQKYLEIGVRKPEENFNKILASEKYGVDPGVEFEENPVEFKMKSDEFFDQLGKGSVLSKDYRFDVIFVDGLHTAEQADRDIVNSLQFLSDDGYVIVHDCNPPSEYHAREKYDFWSSPALDHWNGTTWKAFFKHRRRNDISSCCIDSDWGVGILSKRKHLGAPCIISNDFFEYDVLKTNRKECLNLCSFEELKQLVSQSDL